MLKKEIEQRQAIEMMCTDMLVPQDHLLRKIDKAVDFTHIYEFVEGCYSEENGRPSIDPVVLFKLVMIQHLFGIRSLRQTQAEAEVNVGFWDIRCRSRSRTFQQSATRSGIGSRKRLWRMYSVGYWKR